jgi:hypothetical protein
MAFNILPESNFLVGVFVRRRIRSVLERAVVDVGDSRDQAAIA